MQLPPPCLCQVFVLGDDVIVSTVYEVAMMPVLVLAAQLCPEGVEATLFASLMSVMNAASAVGDALGAGLTAALGVTADNFSNLIWLVLICNLLALLPLAFVHLLPAEALVQGEDGEEGEEGDKRVEPGSVDGARSGGDDWFRWLKRRGGNSSSETETEEKQGLMSEIEMR